jgi:flagellar motor switch protein FliN/FliY
MAPLAWIRRITEELPASSTIPLFGNAPPFDFHKLAKIIASHFSISHLAIHTKDFAEKDGSEIEKGLGKDILYLPIHISPLGTVFWLMSREDVIKLTSWLMKKGGRARALSSELLQEGFYRYLAIEAMHCIQEMEPFKELTLQITEEETPSDKTFCIDTEIDINHKSAWGRLAIPNEFRSSWIKHFSKMTQEYVPTELAKHLELVLNVKVGSCILHQDEWDNVEIGDFILLDRASFDPGKKGGIAMLSLQSTPLFNAKIHNDKIEIVDYAFYYEDQMQEGKKTPTEGKEKVPQEEAEVVALKELPLYVTVEIAKVKITLEKLMQLTPGNTLELPIHPDQGVSLVVNGKKVGRAELIHLGEQLGVRILEIG